MASLYTSELLPKTSEEAIRIFSERFLAASIAEPADSWSKPFTESVSSPVTEYPMSAFVSRFRETRETSSTLRKFLEKSFTLKVAEYDDGYEAPLLELLTNTFRYKNWGKIPARFVDGKRKHIAKNCAALLESGLIEASPWDDLPFFDASHQANPFDASVGTFSNYQSVATDPTSVAALQAERTAMRLVLDENGDKLGVEPDEIWLPTQKFQAVADRLNQDRLASGESNPLYGTLKPVHMPYLTDANDFYLVDSKLLGDYSPMVAAEYTTPNSALGLRTWDESSDFFKDSSKIKVSMHIWCGFHLVFPHAIRRIVGT